MTAPDSTTIVDWEFGFSCYRFALGGEITSTCQVVYLGPFTVARFLYRVPASTRGR